MLASLGRLPAFFCSLQGRRRRDYRLPRQFFLCSHFCCVSCSPAPLPFLHLLLHTELGAKFFDVVCIATSLTCMSVLWCLMCTQRKWVIMWLCRTLHGCLRKRMYVCGEMWRVSSSQISRFFSGLFSLPLISFLFALYSASFACSLFLLFKCSLLSQFSSSLPVVTSFLTSHALFYAELS